MVINKYDLGFIFCIDSSLYHFRWEQVRPKYHYPIKIQKQVENHVPNHEIVSDKLKLVNCLRAYYEKVEKERER